MFRKLPSVGFAALAAALCSAALSGATTTTDFLAPYINKGFQLASPGNGYGQPLNIIISAKSDPTVLREPGFLLWAESLGFSQSCLNPNASPAYSANLGDGNGWQNQTLQLSGPCFKKFTGGNHLRVFPQTGNAIFIAAVNEDVNFNPNTNGYDQARDEIINIATNGTSLKSVWHNDITWHFNVTSVDVTGLLNSGNVMNGTVLLDGGVPTDGIVKLLTINVTTSQS